MKCHSCKCLRKHKTRQYDGVCCKFWISAKNDDICWTERVAEMERRRTKGMKNETKD